MEKPPTLENSLKPCFPYKRVPVEEMDEIKALYNRVRIAAEMWNALNTCGEVFLPFKLQLMAGGQYLNLDFLEPKPENSKFIKALGEVFLGMFEERSCEICRKYMTDDERKDAEKDAAMQSPLWKKLERNGINPAELAVEVRKHIHVLGGSEGKGVQAVLKKIAEDMPDYPEQEVETDAN